jgi:hypothetical protein
MASYYYKCNRGHKFNGHGNTKICAKCGSVEIQPIIGSRKRMLIWLVAFLVVVGAFTILYNGFGTEEKEPTEITSNENSVLNGNENEIDSVIVTKVPEFSFSELMHMTNKELRLARNTIYAKYGKIFKSKDLALYFNQQKWYRPNITFSHDMLSKFDVHMIKLISIIEESGAVLWSKSVDLDGDENDEYCMFIESKDHKTAFFSVDEKVIKFRNNWESEGDYSDSTGFLKTQEIPYLRGFEKWKYGNPNKDTISNVTNAWDDENNLSKYWHGLLVGLINIDKNDSLQEIIISQRFYYDVGPGRDNLIITKYDNEIKSFAIGSNAEEGGDIFICNNSLWMENDGWNSEFNSYCVRKGVLYFKEEIIMASEKDFYDQFTEPGLVIDHIF